MDTTGVKETLKVLAVVLLIIVFIGGIVWFNVWRIKEFSKATGMGFWKAAIILNR